jgi:hypothetical protein
MAERFFHLVSKRTQLMPRVVSLRSHRAMNQTSCGNVVIPHCMR